MQEQFTAWSVLVDAGLIGALLAVGTLARAVITPLQTLMIPASVIAGILGLALGPNGLGWLPFSSQLGTYGSILIVIVFVCIALTDDFDVRKIGRPVGAFASYGVLIYSSQVAIGALVTLVLLQPLFDAPDSFAALLFAGWAGGFGSAAAVGQAYAANGDATVTSLAYTSATVGMIVGVVGGIIQAKIGAQRGHAREFAGLTSIPEELRTGVLNQVEERPVIGRHTFSAASVESLAFQVGVVAMIAAAAHGVVSWITAVWPSVVGEDGPQLIIPAFAIAFLLGLIARVLFQATKTAKFLDPGSLNSVSGTATDILIVCGIAAIAPTVVVDYWQPLLLLFVIGLALALFLGIVVAPRVMTDAWFEKQLFTWGWATGAVATGVAMLRIVDPKLKSGTMEQFGVAYIPVVPVEIAAVSFVPLLLIAGLSWAVVGIWGAIAIIAIIAAVWLRRTDPALADELAARGFPPQRQTPHITVTFSPNMAPHVVERAREILREEWDRRVQLAQEHRDDDDSGAVRRAFVALNAEGVLAVEALGYDNDEGHELATEEAGDVGAEGYVFFHAQDVERVVDGPGTLHLRYAAARYTATSAADKYAEDEAVGRRVVAALEGEGLAPTWDGSGASTITLERLRWYPVPGDA